MPNFHSGANLEVEITRDQFQKLIDPVLEKLKRTVQTVIEESGLDLNQIDEYVLVGGSSRLLCVRDWVEQYFGKPPNTAVNPDEAAVIGATLKAAKLVPQT